MTDAKRVAEPDEDDPPSDAVNCPDFPWTDDPDEQRRGFILGLMASPDIDGKILVQNMRRVEQWLKTGKAPESEAARRPKFPKED